MSDTQLQGRREGFSLVEVLIATMILTVGLLSMAASTGYISKELKSSIYDTQRTHAKEQMVEQLRAMTYANVQTTSTAVTAGPGGRYNMTWTVTMSSNNLVKKIQLITSGPGYGANTTGRTTVVDTMYFEIVSP